MKAKLFGKENVVLNLALVLSIGAFGIEKIFEKLIDTNSMIVSLQALIYTAITAIVIYALYNTKDVFKGLIVATFSFAFLPPVIDGISTQNLKAAAVYYAVRYASKVMFIFLAYKLYAKQKDIKLLPIITAFAFMPFMEVFIFDYAELARRRLESTSIPHFITAFGVAIVFVTLMAMALYYKGETARFITTYEFLFVGFEIIRKASTIIIRAALDRHIGTSWPCWIVFYTVVLVLFAIVRQKTQDKK